VRATATVSGLAADAPTPTHAEAGEASEAVKNTEVISTLASTTTVTDERTANIRTRPARVPGKCLKVTRDRTMLTLSD